MADDYDSPWKEAIASGFADFIGFYFPAVHTLIDWSQPFVFLEQELRSVLPEDGPQSSFVDKLVRVSRRDGQLEWVFVHIEIQCQPQASFAGRMFRYHARLYERHQQPIASLAVLADDRQNWRPDSFAYEIFGCRLGLHFPVAKLLDWAGSDARLVDNRNPFALITRAHLATQATRGDTPARERIKTGLVRELYRSGLDRQRIIDLFRVIDWMMKLPKDSETRFRQTVATMEEEAKMRYVTSIERLAIEEGMAKGVQQGMQQGMRCGLAHLLMRQIHRRFGDLPAWAKARMEQASEADLEIWGDRVLTAGSIDAVFGASSATATTGRCTPV
ncbi:MAG: hypothetical protein RL404_2687 [Pseudomonadota bacterium]|jgi:hypothetical protein